MIKPVGLRDRQVIDRGEARFRETVGVELPVLVAIRPEPVPAIVVPFIGIAHGDAVFMPCPKLLEQSVVQLFRPFAAAAERTRRLEASSSRIGVAA